MGRKQSAALIRARSWEHSQEHCHSKKSTICLGALPPTSLLAHPCSPPTNVWYSNGLKRRTLFLSLANFSIYFFLNKNKSSSSFATTLQCSAFTLQCFSLSTFPSDLNYSGKKKGRKERIPDQAGGEWGDILCLDVSGGYRLFRYCLSVPVECWKFLCSTLFYFFNN